MAGSIAATGMVPFSAGVYGASKAASNFLVRRAHQENPDLIIFAMHPGYVPPSCFNLKVSLTRNDRAVATEGALKVVESMGMADQVDNPDVFTTLEKSVTGMIERVSFFSPRTLTVSCSDDARSTTQPGRRLRVTSCPSTVQSCHGRFYWRSRSISETGWCWSVFDPCPNSTLDYAHVTFA